MRERKKLGQKQAATRAGIDQGYLSELESGKSVNASLKTLKKLARVYGTTVEDIRSSGKAGLLSCTAIRVLGSVPCGHLELVDQQTLEQIMIPTQLLESIPAEKVFAVLASGDSLVGDGIRDGDYLIVQKSAPWKSGAIYVVRVRGECCARHVYRDHDGIIRLVSSAAGLEELKETEVELLGRVILFGKWSKV